MGTTIIRNEKGREEVEGLRACPPPGGLGLGDAFQLLKEDLASAVRSFRASKASAVWGMCGGAAPDHFGHLAGVHVKLFASAE